MKKVNNGLDFYYQVLVEVSLYCIRPQKMNIGMHYNQKEMILILHYGRIIIF